MFRKNIDREWEFALGAPAWDNSQGNVQEKRIVNLPHDFLIETDSYPDAPGGTSTGYFGGGIGTYTKYLDIPADFGDKRVIIEFDGSYMNTSIELNGQVITRHNYGYTPFHADLTEYIRPGGTNRLSVTVNNTMQPNSRWYSGAGLYRHVDMLTSGQVYIAPWGIFAYTSHITNGNAFVIAETTVVNKTAKAVCVWVDSVISSEGIESGRRRGKIYIPAGGEAVARVQIPVMSAHLWDIDDPHLYTVSSVVSSEDGELDSDSTDFGIRTISADPANGFMLNGRGLKLKGGCIHHDHGILGAEAFYDSEYRKVKIHKDNGYNALRTAHNPPSRDLLTVCDRLGVLVMDEAFDCWYNGKNTNDYGLFFEHDWEREMEAFILRDRNHPSVIIWSTGNEITERAGMSKGYLLAAKLAGKVRSLDPTRLVSNGVCSLFSGLEDDVQRKMAEEMRKIMESGGTTQNADTSYGEKIWGDYTEAFVSMLDVVGYNYMNRRYEKDGERYPGRVICGTESFPSQYDTVWDDTTRLSYVIGDFTWTSFDYIGEAGLGNNRFIDPSEETPSLMALSSRSNKFPWRLANDADFDILGFPRPQLAFRKVVWGADDTFVYTQDPQHFGMKEVISMWGFKELHKSWTWPGAEKKPIQVTVFSGGDEVELIVNGKSLGRKPAGSANRFTVVFETDYETGSVEAVSYRNGEEISRASLKTAGLPAKVSLYPERTWVSADGSSLCYVTAVIEDSEGNHVPDSTIELKVEVSGAAELAGFGSANPITSENYTSGCFTSFDGRAQAIIRAGTNIGTATLKVVSDIGEAGIAIEVK